MVADDSINVAVQPPGALGTAFAIGMTADGRGRFLGSLVDEDAPLDDPPDLPHFAIDVAAATIVEIWELVANAHVGAVPVLAGVAPAILESDFEKNAGDRIEVVLRRGLASSSFSWYGDAPHGWEPLARAIQQITALCPTDWRRGL